MKHSEKEGGTPRPRPPQQSPIFKKTFLSPGYEAAPTLYTDPPQPRWKQVSTKASPQTPPK